MAENRNGVRGDDARLRAATEVLPETLMRHALALCRLAKAAKLTVTPGRVIDVFRALRSVEWLEQDDLRLTLRTNLASSREEEETFDRVFASYWYGSGDDRDGRMMGGTELLQRDIDQGFPDAHEDIKGQREQFSAEDIQRSLNLSAR